MINNSCSCQSSKRLKFRVIPLDILINHIFVELPVSSLARCRCVCKQWLQALSEPEFTMLHHNRQFQKPNKRKILCGPMHYHNFPYKADCIEKHEALRGVFYSLDIQSSSDDVVAARLPGFREIHYSVDCILGYSNGMVCMGTRKNGMGGSVARHLLFGNPSTGVYTLLSDPITGRLFCGFGYDSYSDDYKFVRVVGGMTHIFSLKSNSWRITPTEIVVNDMYGGIGHFLDGSIYWLLKGRNSILSFDLKDELFRELPPLPSRLLSTLPVNFPFSHRSSLPCSFMSMKVVGGSVCITDICYKSYEVVMWSLFNEGETYSWKKLMNATLPQIWKTLTFDPICFTEDRKILFFVWKASEETCYIVIDPISKKIEDFTIPKLSDKLLKEYRFEAHLSGYIDTLVSPY